MTTDPNPATGHPATHHPATDRPALPPERALTPSRIIRMRTVLLGLVLIVIAGAVLADQVTDLTVDPGVVVLALMIGGGLLLIAGARRS